MNMRFADGEPSTSVPLSHSAAKHRMAIRPKRKHGNPRSKKPVSLPPTFLLFRFIYVLFMWCACSYDVTVLKLKFEKHV